jgi:hypothetical protein
MKQRASDVLFPTSPAKKIFLHSNTKNRKNSSQYFRMNVREQYLIFIILTRKEYSVITHVLRRHIRWRTYNLEPVIGQVKNVNEIFEMTRTNTYNSGGQLRVTFDWIGETTEVKLRNEYYTPHDVRFLLFHFVCLCSFFLLQISCSSNRMLLASPVLYQRCQSLVERIVSRHVMLRRRCCQASLLPMVLRQPAWPLPSHSSK